MFVQVIISISQSSTDPEGAGVEEVATIRVISNDPYARYVDLSVTGMQAAYD